MVGNSRATSQTSVFFPDINYSYIIVTNNNVFPIDNCLFF